MMEGSRVGFFSSGVMWALFMDGKQPEDREEFTSEMINGRISGVIAWRREESVRICHFVLSESVLSSFQSVSCMRVTSLIPG